MSERICETCKYSGNLLGRHVMAWCNKFHFERPDSKFGCNHHEPKPPSKRERIIEAIERWERPSVASVMKETWPTIEQLADRIMEIVNE